MIDTIATILASLPGIADWRLAERRREGAEAFFVREELDMARQVEALDYRLSVYVDGHDGSGARCRGEASVSLHPSFTEAEIRAAAERARFAASKSRNPWYPLPEASPTPGFPQSGFACREPASWLDELRKALYSGKSPVLSGTAGSPRVNSLELFLTRVGTRQRNSRGLDAAWQTWRGYIEYTVDAPSAQGPVELTDFISFSEPDMGFLAAQVRSRLDLVADRARAVATPKSLDLPLILTGKEATEVLGYWFHNLNASRVYSRASPLVLGQALSGTGARTGDFDPLEITAEAFLPGSPDSAPRDVEGSALERLALSPAGVATRLSGPLRHTHYLGLPAAGDHPLFSVAPGTQGCAELRSRPHLEVAYFSDFGVDLDTGDFGAEIRLGYVSDGRSRYPVTGGSVAGNLGENALGLRLSRELALTTPMYGPEAVLLPKVSITGGGVE